MGLKDVIYVFLRVGMKLDTKLVRRNMRGEVTMDLNSDGNGVNILVQSVALGGGEECIAYAVACYGW